MRRVGDRPGLIYGLCSVRGGTPGWLFSFSIRLLCVVLIPVLMAALLSFRSTAGSRGVLLDALALRGVPRVSEHRFEGEIAPLDEELGPRKGNNWGHGPLENWGRGNGPIRYMSMSRVNVTTGSSLPVGKNTG